MKAYRLLLLEDSEDDALLLERFLKRQGMCFTLKHVMDMPSFQAAYEEGSLDAVLCDFHFPGADALDVLTWVRERDPDIPFMVLSGKVGEELAVAVMRAGANDFLVKGQLARLAPAIEREVRDAETRRQHRQLDKERVTLHHAVSQMPDGLLITDAQGTILFANPAMQAISGYDLTELYGQNPRLFKSGRQSEAFYAHLWDTLTSGQQWRGTFINRKKTGEHWYSEALIAPVIGSDGRITHFVCTNRDVTNQRNMEMRLQESQRMEALGLLTAGVAHDFNNLLMPILVHAEMGLRRSDLSSREVEQFHSIMKQVDRAKSLIRQLVSYARGGHEAQEPVWLDAFMEESQSLLRAAIPSEHRFESRLVDGPLTVLCAPTRLQQILLNLCSNAIQAMEGRPGTIRLALYRQELDEARCVQEDLLPAGTYACLELSDSGCGMPPELLEKVFLPFVTTKPRHQGTGLGLSIVLGLVREMGGGIQVESTLGQGTTFRILLPVFKGARPLLAPDPAQSLEHAPHLSLLMVEDDATLLSVTSRAIRELGHTVRALRTPSKALLWFREHGSTLDAVVLDYSMPECSGLDLLEAFRQVRPGLPAVLITGNLDQVDVGKAKDLGLELLQKPVRTRDLMIALAKVLPL